MRPAHNKCLHLSRAFALHCVLAALPLFAGAQAAQQALEGTAHDAITGLPVEAAEITVFGEDTLATSADSAGRFFFSLAPGRYIVTASREGYLETMIEHVLVYSGKQAVQDIPMNRLAREIGEVQVHAQQPDRQAGFDQWNIQNFAAVFYDPARVVNSNAAAINIDDGTNHITVRGSSPNYVQWKLEEVEIVNPNHLENGGTISDRPAWNGGGVSMISAQLMERSSFRFAPFDAIHGNALSGLFDMRLRKGNSSKREHIIQASLLGIDLSTEGPFSKKGQASYLLNFRYSTIGLLTQLGVDFGDERTTFADVSHMVWLPFSRGFVKIFGINGKSSTLYGGRRDSNELRIQKELQDIDYRSATSVNGIAFMARLGESGYFRSVIAHSSKNTARNATPLYAAYLAAPLERDRLTQDKWSSVHYLSGRLGPRYSVRLGTYLNYFVHTISTGITNDRRMSGKYEEPVLQPFVAFDHQVNKRLTVSPGLHLLYLPRPGYSNLQPRIELRYNHPLLHQINFSYGSSAQLANPALVLADTSNMYLRPAINHALSLSHLLGFTALTVRNELYMQRYRDVASDSATGFSSFNYFNELVFLPLKESGDALIYGWDLNVQRTHGQLYFVFSSSIYNSVYSVAGLPEKKSRFNTGYNTYLTIGREQRLSNPQNTWSADMRGVYRNGFLTSRDSIPSYSVTFDSRLPVYWRLDLRLSYKKNKARSTVIWALDLQNLTGRRNVAFYYFDRITAKTETRYHLGLIPVLSYKVMF